ncbi:MAG: hypothetical protein IPO27_14910 [Bacteroidetes bacterium]|nr:hypothetical protein [Bacteroidota bacterium]
MKEDNEGENFYEMRYDFEAKMNIMVEHIQEYIDKGFSNERISRLMEMENEELEKIISTHNLREPN